MQVKRSIQRRIVEPGCAIHVLVVDDSAVVRQVLSQVLSADARFTVSAASDPLLAMARIKEKRPDVIILDLEMPRMDGLTFLRKIMAEDPIPVVICSGVAGRGTQLALQALDDGAVEVVAKPKIGVGEFLYDSRVELMNSVLAASAVGRREKRAAGASTRRGPPDRSHADLSAPPHGAQRDGGTVIALGASTGGTEVLREILTALPADCPGVLVVQHMPEGFTKALAQRLDEQCAVVVSEASAGDAVRRGSVLIAPGDRHMMLLRTGARFFVELAKGPRVARHRPSIDVLFHSVARAARSNSVGVILTGMGEDGADGLLAMKRSGAATIAQNEATCAVFGMPKEAIGRGAADRVLALPLIPSAILDAVRR